MVTEDLTGFTIAGTEAAKVGATTTRVTWTNLLRSDQAYCYKDYNSGHFDLAVGITHDLDYHSTSKDDPDLGGDISTLVQIWVLSNDVDDLEALKTANKLFLTLTFEPHATNQTDLHFSIVQWASNARAATDKSVDVMNDGQTIYFRIVISGNACTVGIYSTSILRDAGDGTDGNLDNIAIILTSATLTFQYLFAMQSRDRFDLKSSGYVENLNINEAAPPTIKPFPSNIATSMRVMDMI